MAYVTMVVRSNTYEKIYRHRVNSIRHIDTSIGREATHGECAWGHIQGVD